MYFYMMRYGDIYSRYSVFVQIYIKVFSDNTKKDKLIFTFILN